MRTIGFVLGLVLAGVGLTGCMDGMKRGVTDSHSAADALTYTCTRCGGSHAQPGNCPKCGMAMKAVSTGQPSAPASR